MAKSDHGLEDTFTLGVAVDAERFARLRAAGRRTVRERGADPAEAGPEAALFETMWEIHEYGNAKCPGPGKCGICAEYVLVASGRGDCVLARAGE